MILKFGKYKGMDIEELMASDKFDIISYMCWLIEHDVPRPYLKEYMEKVARKLKAKNLNDWYDYHRKFLDKWSSYTTSYSYENSFYGHAFDYPEYF